MSLSELKRKLIKGQGLKMLYNNWGKSHLIGLNRYVVKTANEYVELNEDINQIKGSRLEFPKNTLLELTEKGFKIYEPGYRDLNKEEENILNNIPRDEEAEELDLMTDTNIMFYKRKDYLKNKGFSYLSGHKEEKGLYYDFNTKKIRDNSLKGVLSLEYEFI